MKRRSLLLAGGAVLAGAANAAEGPALTRILVGYAAGSGSDTLARAYADVMRPALDRTVIVEDKPGAGGTLAGTLAKRSSADGSTLLLGNIVINVLSRYTFRNLPYDPEVDFVPVGEVAKLDLAMAVPAGSAAHSLAEYLALARADAHYANFGSPAAGSLPHFFGLLLGRSAGVDLQHVAYKGGPAMTNDMIGGELPSAVGAASQFIPLYKAGRLRILATAGQRRNPMTPDVPTFTELGYPQLTASSWLALFAPAGIPSVELARLAEAARKASQEPKVRNTVETLGMEQPTLTLGQFQHQLAEERRRWEPVVKASGFSSDN
jgi:tripartite-type tricarboxylate transporter receptor subunit TctC